MTPRPDDRAAARIRNELRALRRALATATQREHAEAAASRAVVLDELTSASTASLYLADDGEIDPAPLVTALRARGTRLFLPVTTADGGLEFAAWADGAPLEPDRWGISVPVGPTERRSAAEIDVVIAPLVAIDQQGQRLGRGAGYYDRALRHRIAEPAPPVIVGYGHDFQLVDSPLTGQPWDVPLDVLVTDRRTVRWDRPPGIRADPGGSQR